MTDAAILAGWRVAFIFPGSRTRRFITMALRTVIHYTGMIKDTVREVAGNGMTGAAISGGVGMRWSRCFTQRPGWGFIVAIVAGNTVIGDAVMAKCMR